MSNLNLERVYDEHLLWRTNNYLICTSGTDDFGYELVNKNTNRVEAYADTETQSLMLLMSLEESYVEIMADPEREYRIRRQRMQGVSEQSERVIGNTKQNQMKH